MTAPAWLLAVIPLAAWPSCATVRAASSSPATCPSLAAGDVVRILTTYDLHLVPVPPAGETHTFGTTHFSSRRIFINSGYPAPIQRLALLHELLHVRRFEDRGQVDNEEGERVVRACAPLTYRQLYGGGDLDLPEPMRAGH